MRTPYTDDPLIWQASGNRVAQSYVSELRKFKAPLSAADRFEHHNLLRKFYLTTSEQKQYWLDDDHNIILLFSDEAIARTSPLALVCDERERIAFSMTHSNVTLLHDPKSDVFYFDDDDELIFMLSRDMPREHK